MLRYFKICLVILLVLLIVNPVSSAFATPQIQTSDAPTTGCQWVYSAGGQSSFVNLYKDNDSTPLSDLYFGDGFGAGSGMARIGYLDFDGDGTQDVFRTTLRSDGLLQWQYAPDSRNAWVDLAYAARPISDFRFGDFDGDGKSDVFAAYPNVDGGHKWVYSAGGTDNFQTLKEIGLSEASRYSPPRVGDFNGDGTTDIFVAEPREDGAWQWKYAPNGYGPFTTLAYAYADPGSLQFGDFDSDGISDVFASLSQTDGGDQWVYSPSGSGNFVELQSFSADEVADFALTRLGDFDDDDITDVFVATERPDGAWQWAYSSGGSATISTQGMNYAVTPPSDLRFGKFGVSMDFSTTDVFALLDCDPVATPSPTPLATATATATTTPSAGMLALTVDVAADRKPISDNIYGLHYSADADFAREIALPLRRWGGNDKSRYNWEINATNHGVDWYYHNNLAFDAVTGNELSADQWIAQNKATDTESLITLPLTGYVAKNRDQNTCGYSVAKYGPQDDIDDEDGFPDCGNGLLNGLPIQGDPLDTSIAIDEGFVGAWVQHLQDQAAVNGPVTFYGLDNEPDIWFETHHDIVPKGWTYDEFRDLTLRYAAAVKAADPNAQVVGPVISSWTYYWHGAYDGQRQDWETPDDRNAHGGTPFVSWYLQQMQAYETAQGKRLLDYLDLHFYPQNGVALRDAGDANLQALRLRSTRALWDPTYVDESWIKDAGPDGGIVRLIPRMQAWVDQNYPGTKLAITEYNWGALDHINGGLAQADILGIFGQEGVGLATLFDTPYRTGLFTPSSPGAFAFRIYRNYDGAGSRFGETSVHATSSNRESLAIYAAERASDGAVTLVVINKSGVAQTADLTIANLPNGAEPDTAQLYRYSDANIAAIEHLADQPIANGKLVLTYPANSISVLVVPRETTGTITPTPLPTSTPTITPTPTATAIGTPTPAATLVPINLAFNLPPVASIKKVNYPLSIVEVIDPELNLSIFRRVIDLEICLYRKDLSSSISPLRLPYEKAIQYFADGIYEMTNGAHIIGEVTIFHNCTDLATDVVWVANAWPVATLSGFGNDLGAHVTMADTFPFPTPHAALQAGNERGTGYTLAHEWGHYMYGMGDQYANTAVNAMGTPTAPCNIANTYQGPCFSDLPVSPSAMSSQWNATGGDYTWLNFSIAANETRRNTHWRLYQADNWTTLTRSADNDPQAIYTNRAVLRRNFFPELRFAAPQGTAAPRIDLPASSDALATGAARAKLNITWRDRNGSGNGLPSYKPNLDPFHYCLSCPVRLGWENRFIYPDAAIFNVRLEKELPIANMNVIAQVTSPEGETVDVPMQDAEEIGNYQAILPYSSGGEHQITFRFTNPNNAAILTNAGATYTVGPNGENAPLIEEPVNQPFTITASTVFTISNFAVDDHENRLADATVLTTTNESTGGRIDQPGDIDFFTFTADRSGDSAVRVTDLALGMEPKLTIAQENGDVIFEQAWNATMDTYLFARFPAQIGDRITISVTDARPTAQGGHYRISAGEPLTAETELDKSDQIYLPFVQK